MPKPKRTTIEITENANAAYERMTGRYGIKSAVSAAIMLLDRQSSEDREGLIDEANCIQGKQKPSQKKTLQDAIQKIKEMVEVEKQQPGTIYRVLGPAEQKIVDDFIKTVGPDQQKQKKRAKKA